jgi:hypothetical protein
MSNTANARNPIPQIVRNLPAALAETIVVHAQAENRETFAALMTAVGATLKFRPNIWKTWPKARQREWLWANLGQSRFTDVARQLMQEWFFSQRVPMLLQFLDTLGIARDEAGYIKEGALPETLDAAKVAEGVEALLKNFPAPEVALYLHLFQYSRDNGWETLAAVLENDERLRLKPEAA